MYYIIFAQEIFLKQLDSAKKKDEVAFRGGLKHSGGEGGPRVAHAMGSASTSLTLTQSQSDNEALRIQAIDAYRSKKKSGSGGATMQSLKALVSKAYQTAA